MFRKILAGGLSVLMTMLSPGWQGYQAFAAASKNGAKIDPARGPSRGINLRIRNLSFGGLDRGNFVEPGLNGSVQPASPDPINAKKPVSDQLLQRIHSQGPESRESPLRPAFSSNLRSPGRAARSAAGLSERVSREARHSAQPEKTDSTFREFYDRQSDSEEDSASVEQDAKEKAPAPGSFLGTPRKGKISRSVSLPAPLSPRPAENLKASSYLLGALAGISALATGLFWSGLGLPFWAGPAAMSGAGLSYFFLQTGEKFGLDYIERSLADPTFRQDLARNPGIRRFISRLLNADHEKILRQGGTPLSEAQAPGLYENLKALAKAEGLELPSVYLMPSSFPFQALALTTSGARKPLLLAHPGLLIHPERAKILAHEFQHLKDQRKSWLAFPAFALASLILGSIWGAYHAVANSPDWLQAALALVLSIPGYYAVKFLHRAMLEWRAIRGAGNAKGRRDSLLMALRFARRDLSPQNKLKGLGMPATAEDQKSEYYTRVPDWAKGLEAESGLFQNKADLERYQQELQGLRPLARWMAHFYARLREQDIQRPPNLLTLQDPLNWAAYARKFENMKGWDLAAAVSAGIDAMFLNALPPESYDDRELRVELEQLKKDLGMEKKTSKVKKDGQEIETEEWTFPDWVPVPKHLQRVPIKLDQAEIQKEDMEALDEQPNLFEAAEVGALEAPDYIETMTVLSRLRDLAALYSTDHKKKFFPLIIGPTGEGKSSLIQYFFSRPELRAQLGGRTVPVVPIPVKEGMTRRELLGGKGVRGIELGFLALAAMNGWVLVLEELNQANGEFLKALNDVLHQIRKQGYFEFEVGGQTIRVKAHPHFWVVGTENPEEGNFAFSRNPHSPDFMKRWVARYYGKIPPAEQAEIMLGLAAKWHGAEFIKRHDLTLGFFEHLVTQFHEKVREMLASGRLGGDSQEPYEFNRRTLHRFLRRYLSDLQLYESQNRRLDERTKHLLLARELTEAYGIELRTAAERQSLWDKMNIVFKLQSQYKIERKDIQLKVTGLYQKGNKLVVEENLVPIELPLRRNGGPRVPGPEHRLTLVPSLARSLYRSLRNRQFHEPEFSTGPTGTAKTSKQYLIAHLLGEPLFSITLDEMTPISEFHGGYLKDAQTGEFIFKPGVVARAMMHDPEGLLKRKEGKMPLSAAEARKLSRLGATLVVNEGNTNTNLETINPVFDNGVLNLRDGQHTAVAGAGFHIAVTWNPVGEGYVGYPMSPAFTSRGQEVWHPSDPSEDTAPEVGSRAGREQQQAEARRLKELLEEETAEIILDQLTGVVRHQIQPK